MKNFATLLTSEQVEQVHQASLEILENIGLSGPTIRKPVIITIKYGCQVDNETQIVKFPPPVVIRIQPGNSPQIYFPRAGSKI